ncbi:MAG: 23S rRNA (adenine(2503)-C(2))-methyltransferase RlmN [Deltaproteobacteria bacterium]|nr:23S rRNA (adenine(2503)-C(2))-methyltransferase RlmN [Deltaproteobacteria bacterium]
MLIDIAALCEKPYRAKQLFAWVYKRGVEGFDAMTDISIAFRERLKDLYCIKGLKVLDVRTSIDGTRKFLSELDDSNRIESVIIAEGSRLTLCVSTQAGCALGCRFCMTGAGGFMRNLTLGELTGQVFSAKAMLEPDERLTNVVLMGMGEPLANYDNVVKFTGILIDGQGFGLSHNKVTVSTAGLVPAMERFMEESNCSLAVSLNATTDEVRDRLMPINRKYPIDEVITALRAFKGAGKRHVTIEYVVLRDVNDSADDAHRLAQLLRGVPCKINLIPFNEFPGAAFKSPDNQRVNAMSKLLQDHGYTVIVRASKGQEIQAACGQLRGWRDEAKA